MIIEARPSAVAASLPSRACVTPRATPQDRFVDAGEYAQQFERGHSISVGFTVATVGALLASLAAAAYVVINIVDAGPPSLARSLAVYGTSFVAMIITVLAGHRYDRRLPSELRT